MATKSPFSRSLAFNNVGSRAAPGFSEFSPEACTRTGGSFTATANGMRIKSAAGADEVDGIVPASGTLLDTSNHCLTSRRIILEADVYYPNVYVDRFFVGFMDAVPDAAGTDDANKPGGWRNADVSHCVGFWVNGGEDSSKICCVYQSTNFYCKYVTSVAFARAGQYKLKVALLPRRVALFWINGDIVHNSSGFQVAVATVKPMLFVVGDESEVDLSLFNVSVTY